MIGPPASGKTTVGRYLAEQLKWPLCSDIDPLLELKEFHRNREDGCPLLSFPRYWPEFGVADRNEKSSAFERFHLTLHRDGFEIDAPEVWDEALSRCVLGLPGGPMLIEFARGKDAYYLQRYGISEQEVYARSFRILPIEPTDNVFVIELFCTIAASRNRNRARGQKGDRIVSDRSMSRIYHLNPLENGGRERALGVLKSLTSKGWSDFFVIHNDRSVDHLIASARKILTRYRFYETN